MTGARAARPDDALEPAGRALATALLTEVRRARCVAAYVSVGTEPPTGPLLAALADRPVLLPVLLPDGDLDWADASDGLVAGPRGLLEPAGRRMGPDAVAACDLLLVPALAVDRRGVRLGRGGGSYDRALARARGRTVALLYDGELVDTLPREAHDVPVDAVVTPSGGMLALRAPGHPPGEMAT